MNTWMRGPHFVCGLPCQSSSSFPSSSCSQFLKLGIDAFRCSAVDRVRGGERLVDEKLETMVRTNEQTNAKDHEKLLEKRERREEPTNKQVQKIVESYQKETEDDGKSWGGSRGKQTRPTLRFFSMGETEGVITLTNIAGIMLNNKNIKHISSPMLIPTISANIST